MSQVEDFVGFAVAEVGRLQYGFADRCGWSQGETDCSGLVSGSAQRAGYQLAECPNSSALARLCHDAPRPTWMLAKFGPDPWTGSWTQGTGITRDQARATRGALKFHGLDQGQNGDGPTGHVGISCGDGTSVEALSHALDLRIWTFDDNDTTYCALLPDMTGFEPEIKVHPMYDPPLQIVADLKNPAGGRWEAFADGRVRYVNKAGDIAVGGMITPEDRQAFTGRQVAQLKLRWYKKAGKFKLQPGFIIVATSGETYVPSGQR